MAEMTIRTKRWRKISYAKLFKFMVLLFSPFLMGEMISILGYSDPIERRFSDLMNASMSDPKHEQYMHKIMSWGCMFPLGGMIGALISAWSVETFGRKITTLGGLQLMIIGNVMKASSYILGFEILFIGRFFVGAGSASLMVSSVVWFFELIPPSMAGFFKPIVQVMINLGILMSSTIAIDRIAGYNWEYSYILPLVLSLIQFVVSVYLPESPHWYLSSDPNHVDAKTVMEKIREDSFEEQEYENLRASIIKDKAQGKMTVLQVLGNKRFRPGIIASIMMHVGQQLSGINAIMAFAPSLLRTAHFEKDDESTLIILGITTVASIFFSPFVERFRRKIMLIIGHLGMAIFFLLYMVFPESGNSIYKLVFLGGVTSIFQAGPGPLVWFITLEIFPTSASGIAQGICSMANWLANFIVFLTFPLLLNSMGESVLYIFIGLNIFFSLFVALFVVETKNKTSDEILNEYENMTKWWSRRKSSKTSMFSYSRI